MVKRKAVSAKKPSTPSAIPSLKTGGKDIIGQPPLIPKINNNYVYGGLVLLLIGGGYALSNPMLLGRLMGRPPPQPGATVSAPPSVAPGQAVTIQGSFNPPVPQAFYSVTSSTGQQVTSGSLGSNVSSFSQQIPATNLPSGTYTVTVSDSPPTGAAGGPTPGSMAGGAPGSVFPTSATMNNSMAMGPGQSGPENISLS